MSRSIGLDFARDKTRLTRPAFVCVLVVLATFAKAQAEWPTGQAQAASSEVVQLRKSADSLLPMARLVGLERDLPRPFYLGLLDSLASRKDSAPALLDAVARERARLDVEPAAAVGRLESRGVLCLRPFRITVGEDVQEVPFGAPLGRVDVAAFVGDSPPDVAVECLIEAAGGAARISRRGASDAWSVVLPGGPVWVRVPLPTGEDLPTSVELRLVRPNGTPIKTSTAVSATANLVEATAASPIAGALQTWFDREPSAGRSRVLRFLGVTDLEPFPEPVSLPELLDAAAISASDQALAYLREGLVLEPENPWIRFEIARTHEDRGLSILALREARVLVQSESTPAAAALLEATALADLGVLVEAQRLAEAVLRSSPEVPAAREFLATIYQRRSLPEKAADAWAAAGAVSPGDGALASEYELQKSLGRGDLARQLADKLIATRPDAANFRMERVRLLELLGETDAATGGAAELLRLFPRDASSFEAVGTFELGRNNPKGALPHFKRALELRPHQPDLRAKVRWLERERTEFASAWALEPANLDGATDPIESLAEEGEMLVNQRVTRLFPGGTSETWQQIVFRAGKSSSSAERVFAFDYDPSMQSVDVLLAERLGPGESGELQPIADGEVEDSDASSGSNGLYFEQRTARVRFGDLAPGDLVAVEILTSDFSENRFGGMYAEVSGLRWVEPCRLGRAVWLVPDTVPLRVGVSEGAGVEVMDAVLAGQRTVTAERRRIPKLELEGDMPGYTEVAEYAHVSSLPDWAAVGRWWSDLAKDVIAPTPEVVALAGQLTQGVTGPEALLARTFDYVARSIRYVGLEFGVHGYKPYGVKATLERRFADCKDKASLLRALLQVVDVDSHIVLVRTRPKGRLKDEIASPGGFDHAILYVPSLDRFVDPTSAWSTSAELPGADQGASALIVDPAGARRVQLPIASPAANRFSLTLTLEGQTGRRVSGNIEATGGRAAELRERFALPATRDEVLRQMLSSELPGITVESATYQVGFAGSGAQIQFQARLAGEGSISVVPATFSVRRRFAGLAERVHALEIQPFAWARSVRVGSSRLRVPLPDGATVSSRFGTASRTATVVDGRTQLTVEVQLSEERVETKDYKEFRQFAADVDALLEPAARVEVGP